MKMTNKMQLCRIIFCSLTAVHVSSDIFAHHQEHLNCIYSFWYYTRMSCRPVSWEIWNWQVSSNSLDAPDDERNYCSKHVEQTRNNKLSYTAASCWSFSQIISWCTEPWISSLLRESVRRMEGIPSSSINTVNKKLIITALHWTTPRETRLTKNREKLRKIRSCP